MKVIVSIKRKTKLLAAKELNHSLDSTTSQHYNKIEDRGLLNEEEKLFDRSIIISKIETNNNKLQYENLSVFKKYK